MFSCEIPFAFVKIAKEWPPRRSTYREAKIYVMRYWEGQWEQTYEGVYLTLCSWRIEISQITVL